MTTRQRAIASPILSTISNVKALNLKALNLNLYYIPKQIYSLYEVIDANPNDEIKATLSKLHSQHYIDIVPSTTKVPYIVIPLTKNKAIKMELPND